MTGQVCGIYEILNIQNNKRYIGQSIDIYRRWIQHKSELKRNCHDNEYLQLSWNKYGEEAFEFNILEKCDKTELNDRECFYITYFNTSRRDNGYNLGTVGDHSNTISEETRQKLSLSQLKRWTEELKLELSIKNTGENNPFYGKHHSEETGHKIAEANRKRVWSEESRAKESRALAERNRSKKGFTHSQEAKEKMSKARKGMPSPRRRCVIQLSLNGDYIASFNSMKDASELTSVPRWAIGECCCKRRLDAGGFIWKYKEEYNAE